MRNKYLLTVVAVIVVGIATTVVWDQTYAKSRDAPPYGGVLSVDGMPVDEREFALFLSQQRANTANYFTEKYHANPGQKNFWTTKYGDEIPAERAKSAALQELVKAKVQQKLEMDNGMITSDDADFAHFLQQLKQENERRQQEAKKGQAVYGPLQYDVATYYDYLESNRKVALRNKLDQDGQWPDVDKEAKLREFYDRVKADKFRNEDLVKAQYLFASNIGANGMLDKQLRAQQQATMDKAKAQLDRGAAMSDLDKLWPANGVGKGQLKELTLAGYEDYDDLEKSNPELLNTVRKLQPAETSGVLEIGGGFYIIRCISREPAGYRSFDEVKGQLHAMYIDAQYTDLIDQLSHAAKVEINPKKYDKINP